VAAGQPITAFKFAPPAAIATSTHLIQRRQATQQVQEGDESSILASQRLARPVSPHLSIYRPQITWYPSALHRITGCVVSGGLYVFGFGYLVAPLLGWHWNSAALVAGFAALPLVAKVALKTTLAFPFVFHCLNGLRHLAWDFAVGINNKTVAQTGWTVVGASVLGTLYLALAY